jgi:hypothetical protein
LAISVFNTIFRQINALPMGRRWWRFKARTIPVESMLEQAR